jgi:hypothetical protein
MKRILWLCLLLVCTGAIGIVAQSAEDSEPTISSYNLGDGIIVQERFPEDSRFRNMPIPLEGLIVVPSGEGPYPVVLLAHGRHFRCTAPLDDARGGVDPFPCPPDAVIRNYEGWAEVAGDLAANGYIVLVPNINEVSTNGFGEYPQDLRFQPLMDLHLGRLIAANAGEEDGFGVDLTGKVDMNELVMMGHSQGASMVSEYSTVLGETDGVVPPPLALLLVTPALNYEVINIPDVPVAVIVSRCDGDIGPDHSLVYTERLQADELRESPTETVWLPRGNHNGFNSILRGDFLASRTCVGETLMAGEAQRDWLGNYAVAYFDRILTPSG